MPFRVDLLRCFRIKRILGCFPAKVFQACSRRRRKSFRQQTPEGLHIPARAERCGSREGNIGRFALLAATLDNCENVEKSGWMKHLFKKNYSFKNRRSLWLWRSRFMEWSVFLLVVQRRQTCCMNTVNARKVSVVSNQYFNGQKCTV